MRTLELLTTDSLHELKSIASARAGMLLDANDQVKSLESLVTEFDLVLTQSKFTLDETVSLRIPNGTSWSENYDRENSIAVAKALAGITPARATDERLWATLSLGEFAAYANTRRPIRAGNSAYTGTDFKKFRLASTNRDRWRENPISRLWWLHNYANAIENVDTDIVRDVIFMNADLQGSLLGRPGVASCKGIVSELVLRLHREHIEAEKPFDRNRFRAIMKEFDFLVGRLAVGAMGETATKEWVETICQRVS
jgi:hypothetical protein